MSKWIHSLREWQEVIRMFERGKEEIFCSCGDELEFVKRRLEIRGVLADIEDQGNGFVSLKRVV